MVTTGGGASRREFLRLGGLGTLGVALGTGGAAATGARSDGAVILLMLVGGPSQLETWDPKPDAPADVRGPFRSIATSVPGVRVCEHLPRLARRMERLTVVRSLHHESAPIHETGHQLVQTGRLCLPGQEYPHVGAVAARLLGARGGVPPFVVIPRPIEHTGVSVPQGQSAGMLGSDCNPLGTESDRDTIPALGPRARAAFDVDSESARTRDAYGPTPFGRNCLLARRLVEAGVRVITVNMDVTVFNRVTWDCHGARPFSTLDDYAGTLLPTLDSALSALIDDLERRGLLDSTLVVATGEFGRTPRINVAGGRDHWPGVWSAVLAGGGTRGGQVIGASDAHAGTPVDRPVHPAELVATMYRSLGINPATTIETAAAEPLTLVDGAGPVLEAFV